MHLMRCEHGHFYDGDKFPKCPHCANQAMGQNVPGAGKGQQDSVTVPGAAYRQQDSVTVPGAAYAQQDSVTVPGAAYAQQDSVTVPGTMYRQPGPTTVPGPGYGQEDSVTVPASSYQEDSVTVPVSAYQEDSVTVPVSAYQGNGPQWQAAPGSAPQGNGPLQQAAQEAMNSAVDPDEDGKTVSFYQARGGIDPVAGWLVCIEGEDFGGSFTIKSGRNFVGRSADMDIVLRGDNSISRFKHAVILYEPKRREFIAQAGESRELFYLNDEVVLNPVKLNQYDILTIGNTRLMFFPCCGENFSWDDYNKNDR